MGAGYSLQCSHCGYTVRTSGPWEFYRDSEGKRKPYGHPVPFSEEAEERGIYGLAANIYCPECDKVHDLILVEFDKPCTSSLEVWTGNFEVANNEEAVVECPDCGNRHLILDPDEDTKVSCPVCKEGYLEGRQDWIS